MFAPLALVAALVAAAPAAPVGAAALAAEVGVAPPCVAPAGPAYYAIDLFTTRNVPGTGLATGRADVSVAASSPFSVALAPDGSYVYDVTVSLERMRVPPTGRLVVWVTTSDLAEVRRVGALDERLQARGSVAWNQFLVVVTWEPDDDPDATAWSGPVAFRGMSRSGMMHTMVGHGALQKENCAAWGYGS